MKHIQIIGAGLSGLIMAEVLSANGMEFEIIEGTPAAEFMKTEKAEVCYYHTDNISKILPVPLKKVAVNKYFYNADNKKYESVCPSNLFQYTLNHTGLLTNSSVEDCGSTIFGYVEKFGLNLHKILYQRNRSKMHFGDKFEFADGISEDNVIINTAPLSCLRKLLGIKDGVFDGRNDFISIYELPHLNLDKIIIVHSQNIFKRISLIGNRMQLEGYFPAGSILEDTLKEVFGVSIECVHKHTVPVFQFNKIDEVLRRNILFELTNKYQIYSLGRYATWSYKRVDHVVDDALKIAQMIRYSQAGV